MNILVPIFSIYIGLIQPGGIIDNDFQPIIETNMVGGVMLWSHWAIEGEIQVYSEFPDGGYFSPYQTDFIFRTYLEFDSLSIGYQHECMHEIVGGNSDLSHGGAYDKIYIEYKPRF